MRRLLLIASVAAAAVAGSSGAGSGPSTASAATFAGGRAPVWSPDGTQIAYIGPARTTDASGRLGLDRVVVVDADGPGTPHAVASAPRGEVLDEVRWADGGRLVYSDSNYTLWDGLPGRKPARRLATLGVTSGAGGSFAVSRDGRELAFTAPCTCGIREGDAVGVVPVLRGKARILVRGKNAIARYPSFSPDGERVVFTRTLVGGRPPGRPVGTALVVETLATGARRVVHVSGQWAAFSPDGRWIAFLGTRGLEVIPASGGAPRTVLGFHYVDGTASFSWSPNSETLAYVTSARVGTVDLAGHATTFSIPGLRPDANPPQWSPDGKSLAFSAIEKGDDLDSRVYVINEDGAGLRRIA